MLAVWDDFGKVYFVDIAQTLAARTSTLRRVEREGVGRWVAIGDARGGTHQTAREMFKPPSISLQREGGLGDIENHDETITLLHGDGNRFLQAVARHGVPPLFGGG